MASFQGGTVLGNTKVSSRHHVVVEYFGISYFSSSYNLIVTLPSSSNFTLKFFLRIQTCALCDKNLVPNRLSVA